MKVKIENAQVIPGQKYRNQWALIELAGMDFPFQVGLGETQAPYPVGEYSIDETCFSTNRYHKLEMGFVRLLPVEAVKVRAAS